MAFELIHAGPGESSYRFTVVGGDGRRKEAFLTYEIFPSQSFERTLLLTDDEHLLQTPAEKTGFTNLRKALEDRNAGRFVATKSVVNAIVDRQIDLPNVRVAVHKFGPVPVFVLSNSIEVQVHGRQISAQMAIFPASNTEGRRWDDRLPLSKLALFKERATNPLFVTSKDEVRQCLSAGLHISFRRYFEDAAEDLHDLRRILSRAQLYRRAKRIERTLAQSISSKLRMLVPKVSLAPPHVDSKQDSTILFQNNAEFLYEAAVGRTFILHLLNEMYSVVGIAPKLHYRDELAAHHDNFRNLLGEIEWNNVRNASRNLQFLEDCQSRYFFGDTNEYASAGELLSLAKSAPELWCSEVAKFAAFVLIVRKLATDKPFVRLFISHHHEVHASECVRDQLTHYVSERSRRRIGALAVQDLPPGTPIRHVIRGAIWLSQGTIAICPRDTSSIVTASTEDKDYRWIARETEYSLLLDKPVLFGIETNTPTDNIRRDFADSKVGYLVTGTKVPKDAIRAERVLEYFTERLRSNFNINSSKRTSEYLDPNLKADAELFAGQVALGAVSDLLDGYVRQFESDARRTLFATLVCLGPLGKCTRPELLPKLARVLRVGETAADKAFANMWRQVRDRYVGVPGGRPTSLIELRNGRYMERLTGIAWMLRRTLGIPGYRRWRGNWLNTQARNLGIIVDSKWTRTVRPGGLGISKKLSDS